MQDQVTMMLKFQLRSPSQSLEAIASHTWLVLLGRDDLGKMLDITGYLAGSHHPFASHPSKLISPLIRCVYWVRILSFNSRNTPNQQYDCPWPDSCARHVRLLYIYPTLSEMRSSALQVFQLLWASRDSFGY